jgi:hypothetical protein
MKSCVYCEYYEKASCTKAENEICPNEQDEECEDDFVNDLLDTETDGEF